MFDKTIALKIFEAFSIERWNDLVRPFEMIEMDKSAEKAVCAYIIGKFEERRGAKVDWSFIVHGMFFDLLRKIALCDIKAPVQRMIRDGYPAEYAKLNEWVVEQYRPILRDESLVASFSSWLLEPVDADSVSWRILRAAHKYSAMREIEILRPVNEAFRIVPIEKALNRDIEGFLDLRGMQLLLGKQRPYEFLMEVERLRFQTRWNQTPRVPKTSVLGHSFYTAILTFLLGREIGVSGRREYNNFFAALFHDLPEAVTRDIISPVKRATDQLPAVVKEIENKIVEHELLPLMDDAYRDEIRYFTEHEFENRIKDSGGLTRVVSFGELESEYTGDEFQPIDGRLIRVADHISAYVEADQSISYGITSVHLRDGKKNIIASYPNGETVNGFDMNSFLRSFE